MKKFIKFFFIFIILAFVIIQFIKPNTENPPEDKSKFITAHLQVPDVVYNHLEKACFDCHSNRTKWPWYSKISPVVFLINSDVNEGREELNFSEWGNYDKSRMMDKLDGIETELRDGEMPLAIYLPLHPEAKLTENDKTLIRDWAKDAKEQILNK